MKRFTALCLGLFLLTAVMSGCQQTEEKGKDELLVVCTIFPQYDWVLQILGSEREKVNPVFLMRGGADLHNYQPTTGDMVTISDCDIFVYVGGESDIWVEEVLKNAKNKDMTVINLLEVLGAAAKEQEIVEGMEDGHDHADDDGHADDGHADDGHADDGHADDGHADDDHADDGHDHADDGHADDDHADDGSHGMEAVYDEHIWLSLKNAKVLCTAIAGALSAKNPDMAEVYQRNLEEYTEKLSALDAEYRKAIDAAPGKVLLFGDRFPFRYLLDDYGLQYYAAFPGCSSESEASFETIAFLAQKTEELNLHTIMVSESADHSIAETVKNNTTSKDQQILVLDAMQSVKAGDVQNGMSYLSLMESNLDVLKGALK